jgi:hypothetical protein
MAFTSPQSVLEPVVSRPPKDSSTAYCFAAAKDKPSGGRQIRCTDPNVRSRTLQAASPYRRTATARLKARGRFR